MGKKSTAETAARWREILERQSTSGLSVAAFCREESISAPSFYAWRRRFNGSSAPTGAAPMSSPGPFLPVDVDMRGRSAPLRVFLPHGVCVELGADACSFAEALRLVCESARC